MFSFNFSPFTLRWTVSFIIKTQFIWFILAIILVFNFYTHNLLCCRKSQMTVIVMLKMRCIWNLSIHSADVRAENVWSRLNLHQKNLYILFFQKFYGLTRKSKVIKAMRCENNLLKKFQNGFLNILWNGEIRNCQMIELMM